MQEFGIIYKDDDTTKEYEAQQVIYNHEQHIKKQEAVNSLVKDTIEDFEDATTVTRSGNAHQSKTLFGRVLET